MHIQMQPDITDKTPNDAANHYYFNNKQLKDDNYFFRYEFRDSIFEFGWYHDTANNNNGGSSIRFNMFGKSTREFHTTYIDLDSMSLANWSPNGVYIVEGFFGPTTTYKTPGADNTWQIGLRVLGGGGYTHFQSVMGVDNRMARHYDCGLAEYRALNLERR